MVLLGSRPPGRHVEQHDVFFGISDCLSSLAPDFQKFWPKTTIHIDAWREVSVVDGYQVTVTDTRSAKKTEQQSLFFINLGGYQENKFEEQHYMMLTVKPDKKTALLEAKSTLFYRSSSFKGPAATHIDETYGIDVDDLYLVTDILPASQKSRFRINLTKAEGLPEDPIHLGYIKFDSL